MEVINLKLPGIKLIKPKVFKDHRGYFLESFSPAYQKMGITDQFIQDNHSYSKANCIRGMHFQTYPGQSKLVRCVVGTVFDVVVDIRPESPTFKQWDSVILDDVNHHQLYIPIGFAHGFCVLSDHAHVLYKVNSTYNAETEKGFVWNDPEINIKWPTTTPVISERDQNNPKFSELFGYVI
jgi:dTDP-4-dehydrorhamnose 3,5-epimerase